MLKAYYCYCRDTIFYIKNRELIKMFVDNRIILNAIFFRKINSNYIRSQSYKLIRKNNNNKYFNSFLVFFSK